ncbi:MAG: DUF983 domain-containing protein [Flavobacteriaceae bacterium]|nr:DUF983 domain-containing protein [Flavobacteriaceae bacterium]
MGFLKGRKIYSIVTSKCPVCHTGKMFQNPNPYHFSETLKMNERCPHCNTKFKIEPSFFYGAMYVSYPVGITFAGIAFAICYFLLDLGRLYSFIAIAVVMLLLLPITLRLSRNIWINLFFKFDQTKV